MAWLQKRWADRLFRQGIEAHAQNSHAPAFKLWEKALTRYERAGDRPGVAYCLHSLGNVHQLSGRLIQAPAYYEQAYALHQQIADRHGPAADLCNLGVAYQASGDLGEERGQVSNDGAVSDGLNPVPDTFSPRKEKCMSSKPGTQYYVTVGFGLGVAFSGLLALLYTGKASFRETNLDELLAAPLVVLVAPVAVGLVIGLALRVFAYSKGSGPEVPSPFGGRQPLLIAEVSALGFGFGVFFGPIAALVIFFLAPLAGHGFLSHILFGLLTGGAIGSVIGPLSVLIEQ